MPLKKEVEKVLYLELKDLGLNSDCTMWSL